MKPYFVLCYCFYKVISSVVFCASHLFPLYLKIYHAITMKHYTFKKTWYCIFNTKTSKCIAKGHDEQINSWELMPTGKWPENRSQPGERCKEMDEGRFVSLLWLIPGLFLPPQDLGDENLINIEWLESSIT